MTILSKVLRTSTFRQQLTVAVAVAVVGLAFIASLVNAWQGSRQVRANLLEQGERIAETTAQQSKLALLYASAENAADTVSSTLTFPDVVQVEIFYANGKSLLTRGQTTDTQLPTPANPSLQTSNAFLQLESADFWHFIAPVYAKHGSASPFEVGEEVNELLGYVRVTQSKATLKRLRSEIFTTNLGLSIVFAVLFLLLVRQLANRLTHPLGQLSNAMARAESGESAVRANLVGPKDLSDMAHAFNSMMSVLNEREQQLRDARDEALQFAKLKSEFATTVSHEIRTPLNGVVGTLNILLTAELPTKQQQFVKMAWDSAQYLRELIDNILDFSKLEAGKVQLKKAEMQLSKVIEGVLDLLAPQAAQKSLGLGYLVAHDVPNVLQGDDQHLRQVLINLIGNAIKFTDRGEVQLYVHTFKPSDHAFSLRFEVIDTGIGIPANQLDRIFDSFTQADTSASRHYGGSGLGLAICKQLVELMGGKIHVTSKMGQGSCFWFSAEFYPTSLTPTDMQPPVPRAGLKVLIADESAIVRQFLQHTLQQWQCVCQTTDNPSETLKALNTATQAGEPYELLIVDALFTATYTGNLASQIRAEHGAALRVITLNSYTHDSNLAIANAQMTKPLKLEQVRDAIAMALSSDTSTSYAEQLRAPQAQTVLPLSRQHGTVQILVVEDNKTNQVIAQSMLTLLGCQVEMATNGSEALLVFKRQLWDVIFMDCNMPDMDGFQATAALRSLEAQSARRTPIIAMTANTQPQDIAKCLAAGMDDHLAKPLLLDTLAAKLRQWIDSYKDETDPQQQGTESAAIDSVLSAPAHEPLNPHIMARLHESLGSSIDRAINPFLEDMPVYLEAMEQAASSDSLEQLRHTVHAIKGASGNLGAQHLAAVTKHMEQLLESGQFNTACALIPKVRAEYTIAQRALTAELKNIAPPHYEHSTEQALVLVVDDDRSTRSALRYALQRTGFRVEEAVDGKQALSLAERSKPDVILMDALMPGMNGFTACAKLREQPFGKNIPVLMITALEDADSIDRAFAAGANDYIAKPIPLAVLNQRVKRIVQAHQAERRLHQLANHDSLTGLPNRALFAEELRRSIAHAESRGQALAVLCLDLDRFKFVNDTLGHETGDQLLQSVAARIKNCVQTNHNLARLGGDEFAVVLHDLWNSSVATHAAERICAALTAPFQINGHDIFVSASMGISLYPSDGTDISTLIRRADTAMYRAKRGGNGFKFYEAAMELSVAEQLRMDNSLRRALERNELVVFYQPKATTQNGHITGMEALLRWNHPTKGLIPPLEFIGLAEETGLIIPIGEWVLRTACRQAKTWLDAGLLDLNIAVNLSSHQLQHPAFAELVASILAETGLTAQRLTLEITESVLMGYAKETIATLQQLKTLGVRLEIDDFGTGYSSLAYLKRFPVDALKIDRTFTRDMTTNPDDASIVTGIIALAHSLRLEVVAEGVETNNQLAFLAKLDCDSVQGFYLSEPLPASEFERLFLKENLPQSEPKP